MAENRRRYMTLSECNRQCDNMVGVMILESSQDLIQHALLSSLGAYNAFSAYTMHLSHATYLAYSAEMCCCIKIGYYTYLGRFFIECVCNKFNIILGKCGFWKDFNFIVEMKCIYIHCMYRVFREYMK